MQSVPTRAIAAMIAALVVMSACSGSDDVAELPSEDPEPTTTTSTSATSESTTTASSTTTVLSETEVAEAEIEQLITEYWMNRFDPEGADDEGQQYLTGILATRTAENRAEREAQGQQLVEQGRSAIQITSVEAALDAGTGLATSCSGSDTALVDAETGEILGRDDPDFQFTSEWLVQQTDEGWKISEWYPSALTDSPELCAVEIEP